MRLSLAAFPRSGATRRRAIILVVSTALLGIGLGGMIMTPRAGADARINIEANAFNWFWSSNTKTTVCEPDAGPGVCAPVSVTGGLFGTGTGVASPISTGHMAVAMLDGDSDMRAYTKFSLFSIPFGADVQSFIVSLKVSNPDQAHTAEHSEKQLKEPGTLNQNSATIQACAATEPWAPAQGGDGGDPPYSSSIANASDVSPTDPNQSISTVRNEPASDCALSVEGVKSTDGSTWTFDITNLAKKWISGDLINNGIALLPVPRGVKPTWRVEFHGGYTARTSGETKTVIVPHSQAPTATVAFAETATVTPAPPVSAGAPPPQSAPPTSVALPPAQFGAPSTTTQPGPTPAVIATVPVSHPRTPGYVWALIPLGLLGIAMVSFVVGNDQPVPATTVNRTAAMLRARRLLGEQTLAPITETIAEQESRPTDQQ